MVCWLGNVWACCCRQGVKHTRSFIQKIQFHFLQLHGLFKIWDRVWFYVMYCTLTLSDAVLYIVQKCVHDVKCLCEYAKMLLYQIFKKEKLSVMKSWCEYELSCGCWFGNRWGEGVEATNVFWKTLGVWLTWYAVLGDLWWIHSNSRPELIFLPLRKSTMLH